MYLYLLPIFLSAIASRLPFTSAGYNKVYYIPGDSCSTSRIREIDGATIRSSPNKLWSNTACLLKFESDDSFMTSKRLMINFETLKFSTCDAKLQIYFHRSSESRTPDYEFTCNSPKPQMIYTTGKYATFRLDSKTDRGFEFNIIVTSYVKSTFCREFRCADRKCIEDKLRCDGINHCGDNSDERNCIGIRSRPRGRMGLGSSLASAFSSLIVVIICVVFCVVCFRRRRAMAQQGEVLQQQQTMIHTGMQPGVPPPGMSQPPPGMNQPPPGMNQPPPGAYPMGPAGYQGVPNYQPGAYPPGPPNQPPPPYGYAPQGPGYYPPPPQNMYPPPPGSNPAYPPPANPAYPPMGGPPPGQAPVTYNAGFDQVKMP